MTEEIKEILDTPIFIIDNEGFTVYINDKINDYITNLQKENEELRIDNKRLKHNEKVYKSRNEKAVEYIKQHCDRPGRLLLPKIDFNYNDLLNILEGDDE